MDIYPTGLERLGEDRLLIRWSDGSATQCAVRQLRDACPCATCREKRSLAGGEGSSHVAISTVGKPAAPATPAATNFFPILTAAEIQPLRIQGMKPVGNYAYSILFSDGHDTGIFDFELLRSLGMAAEM